MDTAKRERTARRVLEEIGYSLDKAPKGHRSWKTGGGYRIRLRRRIVAGHNFSCDIGGIEESTQHFTTAVAQGFVMWVADRHTKIGGSAANFYNACAALGEPETEVV